MATAEDAFPALVSLSSLDGTDGFVLRGIDDFDEAAYSVADAGDVGPSHRRAESKSTNAVTVQVF